MNLFGRPLLLRERACTCNGIVGKALDSYVNLFVKVTNSCNARCSFCSNAANRCENIRFDIDKLFRVVDELMASEVRINRVCITGGEPAMVPQVVLPILERLNRPEYDWIHAHLNTNGLLPDSRKLMQHPRWNSVSVSLHHYSSEKLSRIYGVPIAADMLDFDNVELSRVNISCNLMRRFIDSPLKAQRMMDFALRLGVPRLGFVSLMLINHWCREYYVDFSEIDWLNIPRLYITSCRNYSDDCKCSNYLYNANGKVLEVYMRNYRNPNFVQSGLVYDGRNLYQGFGKENVIC